MSDLNDLKLYGRIVRDAVIKTKNDKQIAYFTIANNKTKKDTNGNYYDEPNFFPVSAYINGEKFSSYLKKGQPLIVEGELKQITKEVGIDANGKRLFDSRIYIRTKQIHLIFTGKKENSQDFSELANIPENFIIEEDYNNEDFSIDNNMFI